MTKDEEGYFSVTIQDANAGMKYFFRHEDGKDFPDPASHWQPEGVHAASAVAAHNQHHWNDSLWKGRALGDCILYELHVGTFTEEGTFEAIIPRLKDLVDTGVDAIELMPVAQFPGGRNWGYDGVYPFAPQASYGGPTGLKRLVDACHGHGIAVILDVVYNHLGPEGNYFRHYGPYFTDRYGTPWGDALNFDGEWCDGVRDYVCANALYWFHYFHIDGLRLDAVHMMFDNSAVHILQTLHECVSDYQKRCGRPLYLIAESDFNSPRVINPVPIGGYGFTAQWLDDFHHALYVLLDHNGKSRYVDFGAMEQLAKAYREGFVHSGEYVTFRKRRYGASSAGVPGDRFVVFTSNHDQVGNRPNGERMSQLIDPERLKLAAAALIMAPCIPMLFMGEEYAEEAPFYYFISHSDPVLIEAVRRGRKEEFKDYHTAGESPDPQDENTFQASRLQWSRRTEGHHAVMLQWYQQLIALRRTLPAIMNYDKNDLHVCEILQSGLILHRKARRHDEHVLIFLNFSEDSPRYTIPTRIAHAVKMLDSCDDQWRLHEKLRFSMPDTVSAGENVSLPPLSVAIYAAPGKNAWA